MDSQRVRGTTEGLNTAHIGLGEWVSGNVNHQDVKGKIGSKCFKMISMRYSANQVYRVSMHVCLCVCVCRVHAGLHMHAH